MARTARMILPDGTSHVYARGNRVERLYLTERDADAFLGRAQEAFERFGVECWCYCLMPTHYHFALHGKRVDLSRGLHRLNGGYAQWFNREHGYRGHLFGDRFSAREILDERHLLEVLRYIVMNPVRAGLCAHPRNWRWSSYQAMIGHELPGPVLELDWMRTLISPAGFAEHVEEATAELEQAGGQSHSDAADEGTVPAASALPVGSVPAVGRV